MNDVRKKAEEKAKQKLEQTSAGESDRQKARRQLKDEISSYTGENVTKFEAVSISNHTDQKKIVAAYCRVSTDDVGQVISIEMQKKEYRTKIRDNPQWTYYGTYVDDGFSGTNTAHRPGFRKMMDDAMKGKFDVIITKSVSRFARNLLDCIGWVRKLQELGIAVIFEDVNLNTLDQTSNLILFVLAMVAEEESHMKSEAMQLSLEWRFSSGRFLLPKLLGYDLEIGPDGKKNLVINQEEARTIQLMYSLLLNGESTESIAQTLTELQRPTGSGRRYWTDSSVLSTLRNERYCGDVLGRKTWTPNFRDHKSKKNRGEKNRYYQPGHHQGIVSRAQWNAAQKILNSRRYGHDSGYQPILLIPKGALTGYLSVNVSWAGVDAEEYYRISRIAMGLEEGPLTVDLENEHLPDGGYRILGLSDEEGIQRIARELTEKEKEIQAEIEGIPYDNGMPEPSDLSGFQLVKSEFFSHRSEPALRINRNTLLFNTPCIRKLDPDCQYVELLFNPVERMLYVRPCSPTHSNALHWCREDGRGRTIGATAFCKILYQLMAWEQDWSLQITPVYKQSGETAVLFFDLDKSLIRIPEKNEPQASKEEARPEPSEDEDSGQGFFFAADTEEPQELEEMRSLEERFHKAQEIEKRTFGIPFSEYNSEPGERFWRSLNETEAELMTPAVSIDQNYRVDADYLKELQIEMKQAIRKETEAPQ